MAAVGATLDEFELSEALWRERMRPHTSKLAAEAAAATDSPALGKQVEDHLAAHTTQLVRDAANPGAAVGDDDTRKEMVEDATRRARDNAKATCDEQARPLSHR